MGTFGGTPAIAQGHVRQLRAHSGQCGAREAAVCCPAENMWMNRCNPALWMSSLRAKRDFRVVSGRLSAFSRFAPGFHSEIQCRPIGLTLVGVIGTVWRTGIAVFGVRDAAKWCRCRQVVAMPAGSWFEARGRGWVWPGGLRTRPWFALALRPPAAGLDAEAGPRASTTPKYGHLLPTCRPRATMAA